MALEPNVSGSRRDKVLVSPSSSAAASLMNRVHDISFQFGAISSSSEMMAPMVGDYFGINGGVYPGNSSMIVNSPVVGQCVGNPSSGGFMLETEPGTKHDAGLAVDWTADEHAKLEEGIKRYASEPIIMKYIKIAAMLPDKSVRDVALRCRWLTRKRRRPEEHHGGKKVCNKKDKLTESSPRTNLPSEPLLINLARSTSLFHPVDRLEVALFEGNIGPTKLLLEDNYHTFNQITANLHCLKLHENIDLFCQTRNNLAAILTEMREMPGIMSRMPPLPISIDDDLASTILPITSKSMMYDSIGGNAVKQEPRCC